MTSAEKLYAALCAARPGNKLWPTATSPFGQACIACLEKELELHGAGESVKARVRKAPHADAEQVYALYPRKVGREDALIAISGALKKQELAYLLDKTNQFAQAVNSWPSSYRYFQDGGDRCPNPGTWYRQGRYADDPKTWRRGGAHVPAPTNRIAPPEPKNWQAAFPDFTDRDKPWQLLQPAQQAYIIANMETAAHFSEPVEQDAAETRLRTA